MNLVDVTPGNLQTEEQKNIVWSLCDHCWEYCMTAWGCKERLKHGVSSQVKTSQVLGNETIPDGM